MTVNISRVKNQDFEIIALDNPEYLERMEALDHIEDFKVLEEIFITDDYITVRAKAFDQLSELYEGTNKFNKMIKKWKEMTHFLEWIPFLRENLGRGNNIEKTITWILEKYKVERERVFILDRAIGDVVNVIIQPRFKGEDYRESSDYETNQVIRHWYFRGHSAIQYAFELVVRILTKNLKGELVYEYNYARTWNSNIDAHKRFYDKLVYKEE